MENGGSSLRVPSQGPKGTTIFPMRDFAGGRWQRALLGRHGIQAGRNSEKIYMECQCVYYFLIKVRYGTIHICLYLPGAILTLHNLFFI